MKNSTIKNFIICFGQNDIHRLNGYTFDHDSVAVIKATNIAEARKIAFELFGNRFHDAYYETQFDAHNSIEYFPRGKHKVTR